MRPWLFLVVGISACISMAEGFTQKDCDDYCSVKSCYELSESESEFDTCIKVKVSCSCSGFGAAGTFAVIGLILLALLAITCGCVAARILPSRNQYTGEQHCSTEVLTLSEIQSTTVRILRVRCPREEREPPPRYSEVEPPPPPYSSEWI